MGETILAKNSYSNFIFKIFLCQKYNFNKMVNIFFVQIHFANKNIEFKIFKRVLKIKKK